MNDNYMEYFHFTVRYCLNKEEILSCEILKIENDIETRIKCSEFLQFIKDNLQKYRLNPNGCFTYFELGDKKIYFNSDYMTLSQIINLYPILYAKGINLFDCTLYHDRTYIEEYSDISSFFLVHKNGYELANFHHCKGSILKFIIPDLNSDEADFEKEILKKAILETNSQKNTFRKFKENKEPTKDQGEVKKNAFFWFKVIYKLILIFASLYGIWKYILN